MNQQPFCTPPKWWSPKLSPFWIKVWRPFRLRRQLRQQRLRAIEVRGSQHVRGALRQGCGVLITPNHPSHADCYSMCHAADEIGRPFYFMAAWQVFQKNGPITRLALRHHGCFSIDREGMDRRALGQAVEILQGHDNPLVVFPEGEVYHVNDRVTPFREGPASIALMAARKAQRPIACVPCALKYQYVEDPTPNLQTLMESLEREIFWRPRGDLPLPQRIYRFAEAILAIKELEYLGSTSAGLLPERIANLSDAILRQLESRHGASPAATTVPERVKSLRQKVIKQIESLQEGDGQRVALGQDLDDLFLVVQLFSYPGDYVAERPTIERLAETLDKFEEDVLKASTATVRAARRAIVQFGEPITVEANSPRRQAAATLTQQLEDRVQQMLNELVAGTSAAVPAELAPA